ncbi:hypothetical protein BD410DRAFT_894187 [Rickenella mellea]|uniref:Zn(2)-C6 fungal-type domain-containing protein n=1 Tax=Rickenella mellea TaxID=50990 RepID=A0A4Y7QMK2_9AGAM|nr:hypothetical protein BD410DRAFT_894187 [Rickenella mellea]
MSMSSTDVIWHQSDHSEDSVEARKKSSRACDQCRKIKSKCNINEEGEPCKSCAISGSACTYFGPTYKRGPPKGYIHAIEQRLRQVESVLGAIVGSSDERARGIVDDLRGDVLAREIIDRVDRGPFGPSGRDHRQSDLTKEGFLTAITKPVESVSKQDSFAQRESRMSREIVSSNQVDALPTLEWQDQLSGHLTGGSASALTSQRDPFQYPNFKGPSKLSGERMSKSPPEFDGLYTINRVQEHADGPDSVENETADGFGQLSLDENDQIRFHSEASGIPLLDRISDRSDTRNEGGIWCGCKILQRQIFSANGNYVGERRLPMARTWPPAKEDLSNLQSVTADVDVRMPSLEHQDLLVDLYFTYVHPVLPVIHRQSFMSEYQAHKAYESMFYMGMSTARSGLLTQDRRKLLRLLLLAMFTVSSRYNDKEHPMPTEGKMWQAGCDYLASVKRILNTTYHRSSIPTCQALIILAYRESGVGSLEQGWLFLGMAVRMAQDLGLHRAADRWQRMGVDVFSPEQKQERKQVWWTCNIVDKYMSIYLGRPVAISYRDFDTELPQDDPSEESLLWKPHSSVPEGSNYQPTASHISSCLLASSSLAVIIGCIVDKIYTVRNNNGTKHTKHLSTLEKRLEKWYLDLPNCLRYPSSSTKVTPPPHILCIHIQYWCAVLLLNRQFIPHHTSAQTENKTIYIDRAVSMKSWDICQTAATNISSILITYSEHLCVKRSAAYLPAYLFSAGVMHVATLSLRPSDVQAHVCLEKILSVLKEMEIIWPSATRARELLNGAKTQFDDSLTPIVRGPDRTKRDAEIAFGGHEQEQSPGSVQDKQARKFAILPSSKGPVHHEISALLMAHMLGLDIPKAQPSNGTYSSGQWRASDTQDSVPTVPVSHGSMTSLSMSHGSLNSFSSSFSSGFVPPMSATDFRAKCTAAAAAAPSPEDQWLHGIVESNSEDFHFLEFPDRGQ